MVLVLALLTVGTAVYVSPLASSSASAHKPAPALDVHHDTIRGRPDTTTTTTAPPTTIVHPVTMHLTTVDQVINHSAPSTSTTVPKTTSPAPKTSTTTTTRPTTAKALTCSDFKWQQDAQAAYLANLSDPYGLDGAPGPFNGDGLACTQLPVDPSRPASTPVGAYVPPVPSAASRAALVDPSSLYYGLAQNSIPFTTNPLNSIDAEVGKAPSVLEYFQGWDQDFDPQAVTNAWDVGALPLITWETKPLTASGGPQSEYSLGNIIKGNLDSYIYQYAIAIAKTNLPVVIRLDQESNGNWYPWSEDANGNTPGQYIQMWRHVWNIFQEVGANTDVIWLWSPNRVEYMGGSGTPFAQSYPGNQYVDWLGLDGYYRTAGNPTTFDASFGTSISDLDALDPTKPIFLSEVGATETDSSGDSIATTKASWIDNLFAGIEADPQIIGFSWFDNDVTHSVDGQNTDDDWQFDSDPLALQAFQQGVDSPKISSGLMPDGSG
jgi:hypothetical protein